jgi:nucleoside-diphosphate kinase
MIYKIINIILLIIVIFSVQVSYCNKNLTIKDQNHMKIEKTLSIIKPDAVQRSLIGSINAKFEAAGLKIIAIKMIQLTQEQAEAFYAIHKDRPFFKNLVNFMISGPVVVQVLEGVDAVVKNRLIMGATNPKEAETGTIRREFAESIDANCVHGSDSLDNAEQEINFFFKANEIYSK